MLSTLLIDIFEISSWSVLAICAYIIIYYTYILLNILYDEYWDNCLSYGEGVGPYKYILHPTFGTCNVYLCCLWDF